VNPPLILSELFGRSFGAATNPKVKSYSSPINAEDLARESYMSISAFHHAFKVITLTSLIQYIKSMWLHAARRLMAHDGITAAAQVRYLKYVPVQPRI